MSFCESFSIAFRRFTYRRQPVKKYKEFLDASIHKGYCDIDNTIKKTQIDVKTTNDKHIEEDPPPAPPSSPTLKEDVIIENLQDSDDDFEIQEPNKLEFECDERELIRILDQKEQLENNDERKRFSNC
jgi:hypothetical protein